MASQEWFYFHDNKTHIASSDLEIINMIKLSKLPKDVLVCNTKMQTWDQASRVFSKEIFTTDTTTINTERNCFKDFKKVNIALMVLLTLITFGIYNAYWYLSRKNDINKLSSSNKVSSGFFIFAIVLQSISLILSLLSGFLEGIGESLNQYAILLLARQMKSFDPYINIILFIIFVFSAFKVKRIFQDHLSDITGSPYPFSALATFFFQIWYLQYKVNRLSEMPDIPMQ